ncbi:MAG: hypothetical protein ACRED9_03000 [Caulobacteraceae bacterium]
MLTKIVLPILVIAVLIPVMERVIPFHYRWITQSKVPSEQFWRRYGVVRLPRTLFAVLAWGASALAVFLRSNVYVYAWIAILGVWGLCVLVDIIRANGWRFS